MNQARFEGETADMRQSHNAGPRARSRQAESHARRDLIAGNEARMLPTSPNLAVVAFRLSLVLQSFLIV